MPRPLHLPAWPDPLLRVAPYVASLNRAGDEVPGCPVAPVPFCCAGWRICELPRISGLQRLRRLSLRLPRCSALRLRHRCVTGLPRIVHCPALPAVDLRVTSDFASLGGAGCEVSGLPQILAPPVSPMMRPRVAPCPASSGTDWWLSRVSPGRTPSGFASGRSPGYPEFPRPWLAD